jgi:hypothetical protein
MKTIRRLYFYAVALISLEVVIWGLINLLRTIFAGSSLFVGADTLAQALALILVGVPIFGLHWLWAQRASAQDEDEHTATLRALFLYAALLATLVPTVQNMLALLNRTGLSLLGLDSYRAILGSAQTWKDNLIAIALNGLAAVYFFRVLRLDWQSLHDPENFGGVRRLYRYLWVLYGLIMAIFGVQQILRFMLYIPSTVLGEPGRETFINGLALILVGAPIWAFMWLVCQKAISDASEQGSLLRLGVLYALALAGVITVLTSAGLVVDALLRLVLGQSLTWREVLAQISNPVSIGIPLAGIWAYYGHWLRQEINTVTDAPRRAGLNRFYYHILALIGLVATYIGLTLVLSFIVDTVFGTTALWGDMLRPRLTGAISTLLASLPLWFITWRPMQAEALSAGDTGDHARRSLVRKAYLYLVIFATVIGGMVSGVMLAYQLLNALLSGDAPSDFLTTVLNLTQVLVLFVAFLAYHFNALRRDGSQSVNALLARHEQFPVLVFEQAGSGFAASVSAMLQKTVPGIPVAAQTVEEGIPEGAHVAHAVILSSALALNPPEALRLWLQDYSGQKIVVPTAGAGWLWAGGLPRNGTTLAAQMVRQLAEGQEVRISSGAPAWVVVAYIFGLLFALQLVFLLFGLVMSTIFGG